MPAVLVITGLLFTELVDSSLVEAETIVSPHFAYPWRDGQAEYSWVAN